MEEYTHTRTHMHACIHTYRHIYIQIYITCASNFCKDLQGTGKNKQLFTKKRSEIFKRGKLHTIYTLLYLLKFELYKYQFSSVIQSCSTLCNPTGCSTPGLPVHYLLLELAQTHVHRVSDAIQPSHPLSSLLFPPSIFPSIKGLF